MSTPRPKFYITTPIYYVNALPHIGHAYTSFAADVLARYHRLRGEDVFFLTGTDEHAQKNVEAAVKAKQPTSEYVASMSARWQAYMDDIGLTHDDFIRTTEERHITGVKKFIKAVWDKGDIYKGVYRGLYCVGCEAFKTESDLADGTCPDHKTRPQALEEENYFFKLTKYRQKLLDHIKTHPDFVQPESRRNEIVRYITDVMTDISITRPQKSQPVILKRAKRGEESHGDPSSPSVPQDDNGEGGWGIPFPYDEKQTIYVWFDALVNYLTGVGYGSDEKKFKKFWPADVHLIGKDIIKFHCALWPAMLLSAGLPLPEHVFAHGYFTIDGQKISKTVGNVVDAAALAQQYGLDVVRYFLFREIQFGDDGDYSESRLRERYDSDLANGIGNLTARILTMAEKYSDSPVILSETKNLRDSGPAYRQTGILRTVQDDIIKIHQSYKQKLESFNLSDALSDVWQLVHSLDGLIDREQPWVLAKKNPTRLPEVLYVLLESLRHVAVLLWPFMPDTTEKILDQLGVLEESRKTSYTKLIAWGFLKPGAAVKRGPSLFPRLP